MKKKRWLFLVAMLVAVMMLPITANAAAKLKLNKKSVTLEVGKTVQLKVKGTKAKVKWSTSNKAVAAVSKKGKVSAKSAGSATIKAKVGKKIFKCKVTVNAPATPAPAPTSSPAPEPSLSVTKLDLIAGEQKQLTLNNASGNVAWSSSNFRIADVASDGMVYARFYGSCMIKATCNGKSYSCAVSVKLPDPECYPKTSFIYSDDGSEMRIDAFEAQFKAYQPSRPTAVAIDNWDDLFTSPYTYRIHLKGNLPYKKDPYKVYFSSLWDGVINADFLVGSVMYITCDENGDFDATKDVTFSGPAEIIYIIQW